MVALTYDDKHNDGSEVHMAENCVVEAPVDPNDKTDISILDAIKGNIKVLLYCTLMTMGPLMYGYDSIIVGVSTAIPSFQSVPSPRSCLAMAANCRAHIDLRRTSHRVLNVHPTFSLAVLVECLHPSRHYDGLYGQRPSHRSIW